MTIRLSGWLPAVLGLAIGFLPGAAASQDAGGGPPPVAVATVVAERRPVTESLGLTGRVEAIDRVELRARVDGFLEEVAFEDGQVVAEGDLLYRIERGLFEAAVTDAEGSLAQARAAKELADIELARAQQLLDRAVGTVEARDVAKANAERAAGAVTQAEAQLARARINLGYTEIRAPVAGRIGRTALTRGAVVGPGSGVLATIVSEDPVYVTFPVSSRDILGAKSAESGVDRESIRVVLRMLDGGAYPHDGRLDFVDVTVDPATDTVIVRATFPNPERYLIDGQLVTVRLESGTPDEKTVIPQAALVADQGGVYVFVVVDGKAEVRRIRPGAATGTDVVVEEGIAPGDLVIVAGIERVRPGAPVLASPGDTTTGGN